MMIEPEIVKGFSAVKMMREIRDEMDREVQGMTFEEEQRFLEEPTNRDDQLAESTPCKRGRLSELEGIGKGTWKGIDIDQFIREERDSWDS